MKSKIDPLSSYFLPVLIGSLAAIMGGGILFPNLVVKCLAISLLPLICGILATYAMVILPRTSKSYVLAFKEEPEVEMKRGKVVGIKSGIILSVVWIGVFLLIGSQGWKDPMSISEIIPVSVLFGIIFFILVRRAQNQVRARATP